MANPTETANQTYSSNRRFEGLFLSAVIFVMGGCGLAYEYTFSKIASDILGNSVRQWAIIIAIMLFFMGIGADVQKHISDKKLHLKLLQSQILLGLLGGFGPIALLHTFSFYPSHFVVVQYLLTSLIGLLIGFEIPLLSRINERQNETVKTNLARILKMDYIGALAGALLWVFILPKAFTMPEIGFVLGMLTIGIATACAWYYRTEIKLSFPLIASFVVSWAALAYGFTNASPWALYSEQNLFRDRIVFAESTPYQHIVLTQSNRGNLACYINGHLQFSETDEFIYHENLVHPAMLAAPRHERILILGGGDGLAAREVLKYPEVREIVLVDLDPAMTELAQTNPHFLRMNQGSLNHAKLDLRKNSAFAPESVPVTLPLPTQYPAHLPQNEPHEVSIKILNLDAAKYVEQFDGTFDVIIIDFPDPNAIELAKLYSRHFYSFVSRNLNRDGILVQQSSSPVHAKEAYLCIGRTLKASGLNPIPYRDNVPSFGEWGWWMAARSDSFTENALKERIRSIHEIPVPTRYLTAPLIRSSLEFGREQLKTVNTDITTLNDASVYHYYIQGWDTAP